MVVKRDGTGSGSSAFLNMPDRNGGGLSKMSLNQASNASLNKNAVKDEFVRPVALKEKT